MVTLTVDKPAARTLSGEKAQRIIAAMRESVAEVGIADSTFERVSAKAGVSRGLLHYYFGTKERLLVEVIRRDTEFRVGALVGAVRSASTVDEVIAAMFAAFSRTVNEESGYVYMVSELFVAGRHRSEIQRELGELYSRARGEVAAVLREKEAEGVLALRFDAESVITHMFAAGDGAVLQLLTDPTLDAEAAAAVSYQVYRFLLDTRAGFDPVS
jgi:AcrR family transcriptional regulator